MKTTVGDFAYHLTFSYLKPNVWRVVGKNGKDQIGKFQFLGKMFHMKNKKYRFCCLKQYEDLTAAQNIDNVKLHYEGDCDSQKWKIEGKWRYDEQGRRNWKEGKYEDVFELYFVQSA